MTIHSAVALNWKIEQFMGIIYRPHNGLSIADTDIAAGGIFDVKNQNVNVMVFISTVITICTQTKWLNVLEHTKYRILFVFCALLHRMREWSVSYLCWINLQFG